MGRMCWIWIGLAAAFVGCGKKSEPIVLEVNDGSPGSGAVKGGPPWEALRSSIPGGQVILADDPAFAMGQGWSSESPNAGGDHVTRWSVGDLQVLDWKGPTQPGAYLMKLIFWRYHAYPEETITIQYKFPGDAEWKTATAGMGEVRIEGPITTTEPLQPLHLELQIPTWVPADVIAGSNDPRRIGVDFDRIELHPAGEAAAAAAAAAGTTPESAAATAAVQGSATQTPVETTEATATPEATATEAGKDSSKEKKPSTRRSGSRSSRSRSR